MDIIKELVKELDSEFKISKKFIELVPINKLDWAPHEKSMKLLPLVLHIAELPSWAKLAITTDGLDFASIPHCMPNIRSASDLLNILEKSYEEGRSEILNADVSTFNEFWTLREGEKVFATFTRYETIRHSFSQTAHHRAQLGVYFRLLDIPVPSSYGPSADDLNF